MKRQSATQYFILVVPITTKRTVQCEKNYKLGRDFTILQGSLSSRERKCLSNYNAISMAVLQLQSYYSITVLSATR